MKVSAVRAFAPKNTANNSKVIQNYVSSPMKNDSFSKTSFKGLFEPDYESLFQTLNENPKSLERKDWFILSQYVNQLEKLEIKNQFTQKAKELLYEDVSPDKKVGITGYLNSNLVNGENLKEIFPEIKKNAKLENQPALNKVSIKFLLTAYDKLLLNADDLDEIIKPALDIAKSNKLFGTAKLPMFQLVNRKPIFEQYYPKYQKEFQDALRSIMDFDDKQLQTISNSLLDKILKYNKDNNISNISYFMGLFDKLTHSNLFENQNYMSKLIKVYQETDHKNIPDGYKKRMMNTLANEVLHGKAASKKECARFLNTIDNRFLIHYSSLETLKKLKDVEYLSSATKKGITSKLVLEEELSKEELEEIIQKSVKKTSKNPHKITNLTNCYALISRKKMSKNDFADIKDSIQELLKKPGTDLEQKIYAALITGRAYKNHLMDKTELEKFLPELKNLLKSDSDIKNSVAAKALGEISMAGGLSKKDEDEIYTVLSKNLNKGSTTNIINRLEGVSLMLRKNSFSHDKEFLNQVKETVENIGEISNFTNRIIFIKTLTNLNLAGVKISPEFLKPFIETSLQAVSQKPNKRALGKYLNFFVSCKRAGVLNQKTEKKIDNVFKNADMSDEITKLMAHNWNKLKQKVN